MGRVRSHVIAEALPHAEMHKTRDGKLVATEVYFGWDLPHPAAHGGFVKEGTT
jgi:hypothetical protein